MQKLIVTLPALAVLVLSACSMLSPWVYKIDVQQGNIVTQDMLNKLRPGMEKREVMAILGTPLLTDPFHPQEWIYVYTLQIGGGRREERMIKVSFKDEHLARVAGDIRAEGPVKAH
jgi:outer membrane protein assembly factor BamE